MNTYKTYLKKSIFLVMAMATSLAMTMDYSIITAETLTSISGFEGKLVHAALTFQMLVSPASTTGFFVIALAFLIYCKVFENKDFQFSFFTLSLSILFSLFLLLGISYSKMDSWAMLFYVPISLIVLLGYIPIIYSILYYIFKIPEWINSQSPSRFQANNRIIKFILYKYPFGVPFFLICVCWLPWLIIFCLGTLFPDGMGQLNCFFRVTAWNDHHPAFSTMIMGSCMMVGRFLGSDNLGILIYVTGQFLICAAAFAESIKLMGILKVPDCFRVAALLFYSLFTVWPSYAQCFIKDTLFFAIVLLYILYYTILIFFQNKLNFKTIISFSLFGLLVCLLRKNGIYIIISSIPFLIWRYRKDNSKKYFIGSIISILFVCTFFSTVIFSKLDILKGGRQEALSIPFQQTARYVRDYPDEITEEEKAAINGVLNFDSLAEIYIPEISDPVKGTYHWAYDTAVENPGEKEALKAYFLVWIKGFFKHPDCYMQATLNNIYGYFYPDETSGDAQAGYYLITNDPVVDHGFFDISFINDWPEMRDFLERFSECMRRIPGIGLLYSSGSWTWVIITLSAFFIYKKKWKQFYITVPFIVQLMVCCASPVNGYLRYMLPLMASTPWLIALFLKSEKF